eukprot:CAMPEP_0196137196 /NCGR_PEP_ID=MMETSP0910-20130528/5261_1 /TAXON_ID=49265 /ORGANISM="Thalassiosira rotula, Strain GSO102" /LENGTH=83 /DNA_ID=CAMNT_0041397623 /DNA_START=89 /DNA_END=337 /DNA_ORIENTATION=-
MNESNFRQRYDDEIDLQANNRSEGANEDSERVILADGSNSWPVDSGNSYSSASGEEKEEENEEETTSDRMLDDDNSGSPSTKP